jgi:uncharacterized protein (DUF433 family)
MTNARISVDHRIMGGLPCVSGTRIPVSTILGLMAEGTVISEVLDYYPQLAAADILACLKFAAAAGPCALRSHSHLPKLLGKTEEFD